MIKNFSDQEIQKIWNGTISKKLPINIQNVARRKLRMINRAQNINDLRVPPGNRLEALSHNRKGQYSIRVNNQWRICFTWNDNDAYNVEMVDYH
ncbi:MAG: type II toxin-antitoxin system RelE/ParE family toxin [Leptospirales bacterium]